MKLRNYHSDYYPTLEEKICGILFNITKGHYLSNGNKRVATILAFILFHAEINVNPKLT
ncbi:MAG: hypothetical protein LBQ84_05260 [Flavobacteriaceae bacterium]|jgi:prophage maintenance system killer protein|nr:hypothetical protein [Flavobacteriaceae bacterium]